MTDQPTESPERTYGCSFACGNPYDYVMVDVQAGETMFLCVPCFIRVASDMVEAITNPDNPKVQFAITQEGMDAAEAAPGPTAKGRGKNAPAGSDDDDLLEAFNSVITVDELPDAFR